MCRMGSTGRGLVVLAAVAGYSMPPEKPEWCGDGLIPDNNP